MFDGLLTRLLQGGGPGAHGGGGQLPPHLDPRHAAVRLEVTHPCIYDDFIILLSFIH